MLRLLLLIGVIPVGLGAMFLLWWLKGHSNEIGEDMTERLDRETALPIEMQGRWVDADDGSSELIVDGGNIIYLGDVVDHDFKLVRHIDGAITVSLGVEDEDRIDDFQQASITELVITPEGEFHGYNVSFSSRFVRQGD